MTRTAPARVLCDTSVVLPLLLADHATHDAAVHALRGRRASIAGHAAFESFSTLTRLPVPHRLPAALAHELLVTEFDEMLWLTVEATQRLFANLPSLGISGGAVYDALVAACAVEHGLALLSADERAVPTYAALGASVELVGR